MDPLEKIHEHIHGLILQHFEGAQVLELSLVSKTWYEVIGNSPEAMKKVWLNVGDRFNEPKKKDLQTFRQSKRKYQNFKMSEIENGLQIVLCPKRKWKRAQIDIQSFTSFEDYKYLLNIFNESIQDLELFDMSIERPKSTIDDGTLDFKQLQRLRMDFVTPTAIKPLLRNSPRLGKLIVGDLLEFEENETETSQMFIVQFVKLQPQITHLSLSADAFFKLFENENCYELQLQYLLVESSNKIEKSSKLMKNFETFVSKQNQLKWITLCEWTCEESLASLINKSSIGRISFDYFDDLSEKFKGPKLNKNQTIQRMDFQVEGMELDWMKIVLDAATHVEILYFFHVTENAFKYLVLNCKHLRILKYCSIFKNSSEFYESLKKENGEHANNKIEILEEKFLDLKTLI